MKRFGNLYKDITSFENVLRASRMARLGKRYKTSTARFEFALEKNILKIIRELKEKTYTPGPYKDFIIYEPKMRQISAAPYYDRVIHHALMNIVEPLVRTSYIHDTYACIKGRGTHSAVDRYKQFQRKNTYVLKCDIKKYFQNIDHEILMEKLTGKIKCPDTLWLLETIIRSKAYDSGCEYFDGDNLFTPVQRPKGVPIGNLTSQFFANLYLNDFDHFMKQEIKNRYYIRYCDDFVIFSNDKETLKQVKQAVIDYLDIIRLKVHPNKTRVFRVNDGVDFLGYRIWPGYSKVRKSRVKSYRRRIRRMEDAYSRGELTLERVTASVRSWLGHVRHANAKGLQKEVLEGIRLKKCSTA